MEDHHPVAGLELLHSLSNGHHLTRGLVTEDARSGMRTGCDFFQVGSADAAGVHPNQ